MVIKILSENTAVSPEYLSEHGLSIYIESGKNILFDTGASNNFIVNAKTMGVDLANVDLAVLSHGHYDHGGGIGGFFEVNNKAKVFINKQAFEDKYSINDTSNKVDKFIGINKDLLTHARTIIIDTDTHIIDNGHILFASKENSEAVPIGNGALYCMRAEGLVEDMFEDEQNLIVIENDRVYLFTGCAHRGILNIISQAKSILNKYPDCVIGGFHLHSKNKGYCESQNNIYRLAKKLYDINADYITCHCTGLEEYKILKEVLKGRIRYVSAGETINI